jgi:trimethylamine--corrinoid protein Co-methyltransferase
MGQNGPIHLAGSLALSVARILSGVVLAQCARRGAAVIVTMHVSSMDMRSGVHTYASPEHILGQAAAREMARMYGLPTFGRAATSDSKLPDEQAAFEAGQEILVHALTGENLIHDVGYIESGLTASWDLMAMANEYIGAAKRVARGFTLDSHTLALEAIDRAGPAGNFLADEDTARCFREEVWMPRISDRSMYADWAAAGSTSLLERAREVVRETLSTYRPAPLAHPIVEELHSIAERDNRAKETET